VKKIAKDSRYTPNPISYSLRNNRTTSIAVIIPEIAHDSFAKAMSGFAIIYSKFSIRKIRPSGPRLGGVYFARAGFIPPPAG